MLCDKADPEGKVGWQPLKAPLFSKRPHCKHPEAAGNPSRIAAQTPYLEAASLTKYCKRRRIGGLKHRVVRT